MTLRVPPRRRRGAQIYALPTIVFVPADSTKPAMRAEGLLSADQIMKVVNEQMI